MKKETKKLIDNIINYVLAFVVIVSIPALIVITINERVQRYADREQFIYELYEVRLEAEAYEAVNEMLIDLYEENKEELDELREDLKPNHIYIKIEDDGDYEIFWKNKTGWNYKQKMGGFIVDERSYGYIDESSIIIAIGERISDFEII